MRGKQCLFCFNLRRNLFFRLFAIADQILLHTAHLPKSSLGLSAVHNSSLHSKMLSLFFIPTNYSQRRAGFGLPSSHGALAEIHKKNRLSAGWTFRFKKGKLLGKEVGRKFRSTLIKYRLHIYKVYLSWKIAGFSIFCYKS